MIFSQIWRLTSAVHLLSTYSMNHLTQIRFVNLILPCHRANLSFECDELLLSRVTHCRAGSSPIVLVMVGHCEQLISVVYSHTVYLPFHHTVTGSTLLVESCSGSYPRIMFRRYVMFSVSFDRTVGAAEPAQLELI